MIDTHAHIYLEEFDSDREEVIQRATEAGVSQILLPNIDTSTIDAMLDVEKDYPGVCIAMMGLHPCYVKEDYKDQLQVIEDWFSKRKFIAVGEIGTDLHWDQSAWDSQVFALEFQCQLALEYDVPVVIHCRDSMDQTIDIVKNFSDLRGVFHCFNGSVDQAQKITHMNMYLGLGGVSTFKNAGMDQVIPHVDRSKIILETDSPYLTPAPHRGKRNEPSYTKYILEKIAGFLKTTTEELDNFTTENTRTLFFPNQP